MLILGFEGNTAVRGGGLGVGGWGGRGWFAKSYLSVVGTSHLVGALTRVFSIRQKKKKKKKKYVCV